MIERAAPEPSPWPAGIWREGRLAGMDPWALTSRFGTPLYAYDLDLATRRAARLQAVLPPRIDVAYAVKANPSLAVLAALAGTGLSVDVSSLGELEAALRAGLEPGRVVVTGPGKSESLLRRAVEAGVRAIAADSPAEVRRLASLGRSLGSRPRVLFRLAQPGQLFGMGWSDAVESARWSRASGVLEPLGVHAFAVASVLDSARLTDHVARTVRAGLRLARRARFPLALVDAGGGLGIPYQDGQSPLDIDALAGGLAAQLGNWSDEPALRTTRVLLEPGRFLVGPAGAYVARVLDVKRVHGRAVVVLEGGINHLLAPALVGREHRLRFVRASPGEPQDGGRMVVTGPLCTTLDVIGRITADSIPDPGDLAVVLDVGAYGFTEAMPWFLSHPGPAEVAISGGRAALVRARLDPIETLDTERVPDW